MNPAKVAPLHFPELQLAHNFSIDLEHNRDMLISSCDIDFLTHRVSLKVMETEDFQGLRAVQGLTDRTGLKLSYITRNDVVSGYVNIEGLKVKSAVARFDETDTSPLFYLVSGAFESFTLTMERVIRAATPTTDI